MKKLIKDVRRYPVRLEESLREMLGGISSGRENLFTGLRKILSVLPFFKRIFSNPVFLPAIEQILICNECNESVMLRLDA